jgi:hypothetical protein
MAYTRAARFEVLKHDRSADLSRPPSDTDLTMDMFDRAQFVQMDRRLRADADKASRKAYFAAVPCDGAVMWSPASSYFISESADPTHWGLQPGSVLVRAYTYEPAVMHAL